MRRLFALFLFLSPLGGWAGIVPAFYPKDLETADTILLVPSTEIIISVRTQLGDDESWDIQSPVVLKGSAGKAVRLTVTDNEVFVPPCATNYLIFLKGAGETVEPVGRVGFVVGLTGDFNVVGKELSLVRPDAWSLISRCLIDEKDPACARRQSYILSDAPPDILKTIWEAVKGRKQERPEFWLAYQNIGMRVDGVSALAGFVEPDFKNDPPYDQTGVRWFTITLLPTMAVWFDRDYDTEDYHNILNFARGQRGQIGMSALMGIMHSTQKSDLPELLDIFEHSPSIDIRYACIHNFDSILGHPQPPEVIGWDDFKKHPAKYTRIWKARVETALAH